MRCGKKFAKLPSFAFSAQANPRVIKKGALTAQNEVPLSILRPPYIQNEKAWMKRSSKFVDPHLDLVSTQDIPILSPEEQDQLRASCRLAKKILEYAGSLVKPGVTTDSIDRLVHQAIISENAYPSPLKYRTTDSMQPFPKSICTSVNEIMCHGIPDSTVLMEGDIVCVDVTVYLNGFHGDTAKTFYVGKSHSKEIVKLVSICEVAVLNAIKLCKPGVPFYEIGKSIDSLATKNKLSVCADFCGHGIGREFHQFPYICHAHNTFQGVMQEGMAFTIEPLMTLGTEDHNTWADDWTIASADGKWSTQREHTILITKDGAEALTL